MQTFEVSEEVNETVNAFYERKSMFTSFFGEHGVTLTEDQLKAFSFGALQKEERPDGSEVTVKYGEVLLPRSLIIESWFVDGVGTSRIGGKKPISITGNVGLKYGMRIVANLPANSGLPEPSIDNLTKSKFALEKCFFMNVDEGLGNYEKNFSLPIVVAEVDVLDHKIKDFIGAYREVPPNIQWISTVYCER